MVSVHQENRWSWNAKPKFAGHCVQRYACTIFCQAMRVSGPYQTSTRHCSGQTHHCHFFNLGKNVVLYYPLWRPNEDFHRLNRITYMTTYNVLNKTRVSFIENLTSRRPFPETWLPIGKQRNSKEFPLTITSLQRCFDPVQELLLNVKLYRSLGERSSREDECYSCISFRSSISLA